MSEKLGTCEVCGYTEADAKFNCDHHLCRNSGNAPWERRELPEEPPVPAEQPQPDWAERAAEEVLQLVSKWDYEDVPELAIEEVAALIREEWRKSK